MNASIFISTTGDGLSRASRSTSGDWEVESILAGQDVRCLATDPLNPNVVYAGTQGNGVLRSGDQGRTWRAAGLDGHIVKSIGVSPTQPGLLYAGTKPALMFGSRDGGTSWAELKSFRRVRRWYWLSPAEKPFIGYVQAIALSPTDLRLIVVGIEAGAVVSSHDGGRTWAGHTKGALRDCHSLIAHAASGDWFYEGGGTGAGAACSRSAGASWTQPRDGMDRHYGWAVAADPAQTGVWYVSLSPSALKAHSESDAQAYIFRKDGGGLWQKLAGGLPQPLDHMPYALLTDREAPGHLYAGLSNGDIWHTTDHGET